MKISRELIFIIAGLLLLAAALGFVVYSINFLVINIDRALETETSAGESTPRINFDGLKKIEIMKE